MQVLIYDHYGASLYAAWERGEFSQLTFTSEIPGGMTSASFVVPARYSIPYRWADPFNRVKIYEGATLVWAGLVWAVERFWGPSESGIRVDCVGEVARLGMWTLSDNLSNEKGSTYITDHMATHASFKLFLSTSLSTTDYTIPGEREYRPYKTMREIMDDIYSFNRSTHDWYVWDERLYLAPVETSVSYVTTTEYCEGSLRQELTEYANSIKYSYRDALGLVQTGTSSASSPEYPAKEKVEAYTDNMSSTQAAAIAAASLAKASVLGATAEITVYRVWDMQGREIPPATLRPGKIISITGLVPAKASVEEAFVDNDIDAFPIAAVSYDHESQSARISPGRLPYTLPRVIAG